jgi:hypothetical protein
MRKIIVTLLVICLLSLTSAAPAFAGGWGRWHHGRGGGLNPLWPIMAALTIPEAIIGTAVNLATTVTYAALQSPETYNAPGPNYAPGAYAPPTGYYAPGAYGPPTVYYAPRAYAPPRGYYAPRAYGPPTVYYAPRAYAPPRRYYAPRAYGPPTVYYAPRGY